MGQEITRIDFTEEDFVRFSGRLADETALAEQWLSVLPGDVHVLTMSLRPILIACLLVSSAGPLRGQTLITRAMDYALGGSSVMWIPTSEAVFLNPAEISRVHQHMFAVTGGKSLALSSVTGNVFIPYVGTIAAGVGRETDETHYTLSYGRIFGRHHAAGVGFTYLEKNPDRSGISLGTTFHFPTTSSRYSGLHLGASVLNFAGDVDAPSFSANAGGAFWVAPHIEQGMAERWAQGFLDDYADDIPVWDRKVFREQPALPDADGPFARFRRWYRQFY